MNLFGCLLFLACTVIQTLSINYSLVVTLIPQDFLLAYTNAKKKWEKNNSLVSGQPSLFSLCPFSPVAVLVSLGAKVAPFSNKNGVCNLQPRAFIHRESATAASKATPAVPAAPRPTPLAPALALLALLRQHCNRDSALTWSKRAHASLKGCTLA